MGFLDSIGKSVVGCITSQANVKARGAANQATKTALSGETYAGLNPKSVADKVRFFKKESGEYEVYFEVKQIGIISTSTVKEVLARPKDIAEVKIIEVLQRMKPEFKNQAIGKAVAQKFLTEIGYKG